MKYQPKRSTARWLEGAPRAVLACYDHGRGGKTMIDRYTIMFGAPFWSEDMGRTVPYLGCGEGGGGVSQWGEMDASARTNWRKVKWSDLSEATRIHIMLRMTQGDEEYSVKRADKIKEGDLIDLEGDWFADPKGTRREFKDELARVVEVNREGDSCIVLGIEGVDAFGFPPDHLFFVESSK